MLYLLLYHVCCDFSDENGFLLYAKSVLVG